MLPLYVSSQIVGEVLKQLTEDKFIVKATNGPRYVVGCRRQLDKEKLKVRRLRCSFKICVNGSFPGLNY